MSSTIKYLIKIKIDIFFLWHNLQYCSLGMSSRSSSTDSKLSFAVNGQRFELAGPSLEEVWSFSLNDFLRLKTNFKSPKLGCGEGGCGACIVAISWTNDGSEEIRMAVNSCLYPLLSLDGFAVTTVEGLSRSTNGPLSNPFLHTNVNFDSTPLHPVPERFAARNAVQCGFCTPGMVMSVYSSLKCTGGTNNNMREMEQCLDGNICRCTGYRPILDCSKSFAADTSVPPVVLSFKPQVAVSEAQDLGLATGPYDAKLFDPPMPVFLNKHVAQTLCFSRDLDSGLRSEWMRPVALNEVLLLLKSKVGARLVAGATASGVYADLSPFKQNVVIDISRVTELCSVRFDAEVLTIGGSVTLTELISAVQGHFSQLVSAVSNPQSFHNVIIDALGRIAGTAIRNRATVGGNLAITQSRGFASDLATLLVGMDADVSIASPAGQKRCSARAFFSEPKQRLNPTDLIQSISVRFPPSATGDSAEHLLRYYRVALRKNNSHALVNAAMRAVISNVEGGISKTLHLVRIAVGAIGNPPFVAERTEALLAGRDLAELREEPALREVFDTFRGEVVSSIGDGVDRKEYRVTAAAGFLFKFCVSFLSAGGVMVPAQHALAAAPWWFDRRPLQKGIQSYKAAGIERYTYAAIPKESNRVQAAGTAVYTNDLPDSQGTLHAAHVPSPRATGILVLIDSSAALKAPGVHGFIDASHVKGSNNLTMGTFYEDRENPDHVFVPIGGRVSFVGQSLGIVLAESVEQARSAAALVRVQLDNDGVPPVITITEARAAGSTPMFCKEFRRGDPESFLAESAIESNMKGNSEMWRTVIGAVSAASQKHFYMETQSAYAVPDEAGQVTVHCSTQNLSRVQLAVAHALALPANMVHVRQRRMGGGFGGKASRQLPTAVAAAVAASVFRRPVRLNLDRRSDMTMTGGRCAMDAEYTVSFSSQGIIRALSADIFLNGGFTRDLSSVAAFEILLHSESCYDIPNLRLQVQILRTNLPAATAVRAPGGPKAALLIETIIEHVAAETGLPSHVVREANMLSALLPAVRLSSMPLMGPGIAYTTYNMPEIWNRLKARSDFDKQLASAEHFNSNHRWRKRGVSVVPSRYVCHLSGQMEALVQVYLDGSVMLFHAGHEMGQGIHIKVIQAAADTLATLWDPSEPGERPALSSFRIADGSTQVSQYTATANPSTSGLSQLNAP